MMVAEEYLGPVQLIQRLRRVPDGQLIERCGVHLIKANWLAPASLTNPPRVRQSS